MLCGDAERLRRCEERIGYSFADPALLQLALTHASSTADKRRDNERLEFFGDAVLGFLVSQYLYENRPELREGELTELRSILVRRRTLARAMRRMDLKECLILGGGIDPDRALPGSVLANVFEALLAAIYLDGGMKPAGAFLRQWLAPEMPPAGSGLPETNYKSLLQTRLQKAGRGVPDYTVVGESGPEHEKIFTVAAVVEGRECGRGTGRNKKDAEQQAARAAMEHLEARGDLAASGRSGQE
jgi:ribonuclease-3